MGQMNSRQLYYFTVIAETGSFTAAAKKLGLSQPPLSKQIMMLEEDLGVRLLTRGARKAELTEAGSYLYSRAKDILSMMDTAVQAVEQRGKATVEEATMLDAMVPSLKAMKDAAAEGKSAGEVLEAGVRAAWAGAEHTKDLVATKGRASYVGERGLGHQDPGATSYSYMLEVIAGLV